MIAHLLKYLDNTLVGCTEGVGDRQGKSGVPRGIRTPDFSLRRGTLYPAELPGRSAGILDVAGNYFTSV